MITIILTLFLLCDTELTDPTTVYIAAALLDTLFIPVIIAVLFCGTP